MAGLTIQNVQKSFGQTHILKGINLVIPDGEFVILVGPSGCGKSTLLNCIAGLEEVSSGEILMGDIDMTYTAPKDRDIAMVFQSYALYPNMNVRKNIAFGLEIRKMPKDQIEEIVQKVAKLLQITDLLERKPSQLSGGQRQRVAMGRSLARQPQVFLFDEPLSNLDAKLRVEMRTEIKKLHQRLGTTIVYVTHDQIEAMTLADRIAVMRGGEVQQFGTPQEVYDEPANIFVAGFMGSPSMNFIRCEVGQEGDQCHVVVTSEGHRYKLLSPPSQASLVNYVGKEVILGIRPEQLTHVMPHVESNAFVTKVAVKIEVTEPTGADTLVLTRINDEECECRVHPAEAGRPGEMMDVLFNMEKAVFFDSVTEARIL
ncbi:sn-glycerol-3-phosphate ABC transporter ATP-binding protein UgpC [Reinekea sp.]|jgi:multiple sugar transport system ATP-binding protein|uniref:ABC transporter ATP-binding protein n=1 Tax=Reinekea sp. TaxID=1970455 RepID=UPI002A81900C|nr:sn-glycerol-3-phosphate ABC transporter ATP-binding protein UgpC [Reinekea sp.]